MPDARRILALSDDVKGRVRQAAETSAPVRLGYVSWLPDADESAWRSWNWFARQFAADTGAHVIDIDDGGITGDAFYAHVRRLGAAVLASPKRHTAVPPPSLGQRPVGNPVPVWTWSLVYRADEERGSVHRLVRAMLGIAGNYAWPAPPTGRWWTPSDDPHRGVLMQAAELR